MRVAHIDPREIETYSILRVLETSLTMNPVHSLPIQLPNRAYTFLYISPDL